MSEDFIDELRSALGKGAVLSGGDIDARYHHDLAGNPVPKPRAVVRPRTTEDVSVLLRLCHREGVPVTTQGGMTGAGARRVAECERNRAVDGAHEQH
jgi:FAD/FMN-containing dehydrogenase